MIRLAWVVPRYGEDVVGGAETLARAFVEHLPTDRVESTVLATCARDHLTWANAHPKGETRVGRALVRRFQVNPRNLAVYNNLEQKIVNGLPVGFEEQLLWLRESVNSDGLYAHLDSRAEEWDHIIFMPYLFGTTFWGAQVRPERSILAPCLHDEPYAHLPVFRELFGAVRGFLFNSEPEKALAESVFGLARDREAVVGMGFDPPPQGRPRRFRERYGIRGDYLLYFGRKEEGKNVPLLLNFFSSFHALGLSKLTLVLAGSGKVEVPEALRDSVVDLGFLPEEEKHDAVSGAVCVCQPSRNESFSIVVMEAWCHGVPVLVHGDCVVTRHHVEASQGGLYFRDRWEFVEALAMLAEDAGLRGVLGERGRAYVESEYSWARVTDRFLNALDMWSLCPA